MKKKSANPAAFIADPELFRSSLSVLEEHTEFDFHCMSQGYPANGLHYVLRTQHVRVVFVQVSTEEEVLDVAEVLSELATRDTPPVILLAAPEIILPHTARLQALPAFAGLVPLPFDADLIAAQLELLRHALARRMFTVWLYHNAKPDKKKRKTDTQKNTTQETTPQANGSKETSAIIAIASPHGEVHIPVADIVCCVAKNIYTEVWYHTGTPENDNGKPSHHAHTHTVEQHLHAENLQTWEAKLPPSDFMRVHRSAMVNMNAIVRVERNHTCKGLTLTLQGGHEVKVSREKTQFFLKRYYGNLVVTPDGSQLMVELRGALAQNSKRGGAEHIPSSQGKNFRLPKKRKITAPTQAPKPTNGKK